MKTKGLPDRKLELIVGNTLRYGVWTSFVLALFGIALYLLHHGKEMNNLSELPKIPKRFSFEVLFNGIKNGDAESIAMLGVFTLLLTPLLRVIIGWFGYWRAGNKLYVLITSIVLLVIGISFLIGASH